MPASEVDQSQRERNNQRLPYLDAGRTRHFPNAVGTQLK
jgi:hypothetical protein